MIILLTLVSILRFIELAVLKKAIEGFRDE